MPKSSRLQRYLITTLLLLVLAAAYSPYMTRTIRLDEAYTLRRYAARLDTALIEYSAVNNHFLNSTLLWASTQTVGNSPLAVRLPVWLASVIALALAYRVAGRVAGRNAGLIAMTLLGLSLGFANYAVETRGYAYSIALTLAIIDVSLFAPPTRRRRYALIGLSFLLLMTLPSLAYLLGGIVLWLLFRAFIQRDTQALADVPALVIGGGAAGLFYLPSFTLGIFNEYIELIGIGTGMPADPRGLWNEVRRLIFA